MADQESELELELEDEFEGELESEDEGEGEGWLGALGNIAGGLLGESEDEFEGELEAEDGSLRIFKFVGFEEAQWVLPEAKPEAAAEEVLADSPAA